MSKLTLHRLLYFVVSAGLYLIVYIYFNLDLKSASIAVIFSITWSTVYDMLFFKRAEWKDKYKGQ